MSQEEKRIHMTLAVKKRYAEILVKTPKKSDAKKIINGLFRKKHDGKDIPTRTFSRLYDQRFRILDFKSKRRFQMSHKSKISSMEQFEKKIKEEYGKRKIKIKTRGLANFIRKIRNDFFPMMKKSSSYKLKKNGLKLDFFRMTDFGDFSKKWP